MQFIINYHYFIYGTILSGNVALLTLYCHQEKEELLLHKNINSQGKKSVGVLSSISFTKF